MSLLPGHKLAHYEILEPIGKGGMGEVYRARDTKLGRDVAIKVLPEEFSRDKERLDRFQREARILAQLNHSNIAVLYGLEEHDGQQFLVMELVEGETLAERIARSRIPVDEAIPLFIQIAEGLEAAHEKAIIHRDLKPANIKIGADGKPKILDFGLAKVFGSPFAGKASSESPTMTRGGTETGVILGTAAYMSPEQARGQPLNKRTDIWSFGCCLFEALTGKATFLGKTISDTIARILERDPAWHTLPPKTPLGVQALLRRSLQKNAHRRLRDMWDVRVELEEASEEPAGDLQGAYRPALWPRVILALTFFALLGVALGIWTLRHNAPQPPQLVKRLVIDLPVDEALALRRTPPSGVVHRSLALSPDGSHLAYVGERNGVGVLYLRSIERFESKVIPGSEDAFRPFFSPDSQWLGFFAGSTLKRVAVSGGTPLTLCEARDPRGATWALDDMIYFIQANVISRISAHGGSPELVRSGSRVFCCPQVLPGGEQLFYETIRGAAVLSLATRDVLNEIPNIGNQPHYAPTGHLVHARDGRLMAIPFDMGRLDSVGSSVPVVEGLRTDRATAHYTFSLDGTLVYVPGSTRQTRLVWVNRQGAVIPLDTPLGLHGTFQLSPDGTRLAMVVGEVRRTDIWIYELERGTRTRMTFEGRNTHVVWTPDGKWITFTSERAGKRHMIRKRADGSGELERLTTSDNLQLPFSWSPDGKWLAFTESRDIWVLPMDGSRTQKRFLATRFHESLAAFSPDGHWIAYVSDESGREEIYVQPFPDGGRRWPISTEGGTEPVWSPRGDELFYRNRGQTMVVPVTTSPEFRAEPPRRLFEGEFSDAAGRAYDVTLDGQRFLVLEDARGTTVTKLNVVVNWFEELKRLAPLDN